MVNRPIKKLIEGTHHLAKGDYSNRVEVDQDDEMGHLANAINQMGREIGEKQDELNKQRDEYQNLFERVPCIITVVDRNFRLIKFNREFSRMFNPVPGDYCYRAYKGRDSKCDNCPVEKTFQDGSFQYSEETGINKDGSIAHWMVRTAPIRNATGEIIAAMEINLDITRRKVLEEQLEKSQKKYHEIFDSIPNPVFVLNADDLEIVDCNDSVKYVYGYERDEIVFTSFLDLFYEQDKREDYAARIASLPILIQVKHRNKEGRIIFVDIRISISEYVSEKNVFLVTISDITKQLEAEQQLSQASKLATLGEMATGVAHELNQPL